jgi:cytochrome c-type protein NapB
VARDLRRALPALMIVACAVAGCAQQPPRGGRAGRGIPDRQLGLSKTSVTEAPVSGVYVHSDKSPGESERLPRPYDGAPPLIPHSTDGLLPITRESHACVVCHGTPGPPSDDPPPAPFSHFVDQRNAPEVRRNEVVGARWMCTSCHVPQTNAPPLVGSTFPSPDRTHR